MHLEDAFWIIVQNGFDDWETIKQLDGSILEELGIKGPKIIHIILIAVQEVDQSKE